MTPAVRSFWLFANCDKLSAMAEPVVGSGMAQAAARGDWIPSEFFGPQHRHGARLRDRAHSGSVIVGVQLHGSRPWCLFAIRPGCFVRFR